MSLYLGWFGLMALIAAVIVYLTEPRPPRDE